VLFMISSLILAIYSGRRGSLSVITEERAKQAVPAPTPPTPPAPQTQPAGQAQPPATK